MGVKPTDTEGWLYVVWCSFQVKDLCPGSHGEVVGARWGSRKCTRLGFRRGISFLTLFLFLVLGIEHQDLVHSRHMLYYWAALSPFLISNSVIIILWNIRRMRLYLLKYIVNCKMLYIFRWLLIGLYWDNWKVHCLFCLNRAHGI